VFDDASITDLNADVKALKVNVEREFEQRRTTQYLDLASELGVLTPTNIAAADTVAGIRLLVTDTGGTAPPPPSADDVWGL